MKKKQKRFSVWRFIFKFMLFLFISSLVYVVLCKWIMPPITITQISSIMAGDGLTKRYVAWNQIAATAKLAAIAGEDQLFPDHSGFDWKSIEKSMNNSSKKNKLRGAGASTISQQVAKNVFLWQGNGISKYIRKVPEFYFTKLIEWIWGKQRILEVYLNVIEMGKGVYGIEVASKTYFNKSAGKLSSKEAAMIIACLPNPKKYTVHPVSKWVGWKHRWILQQMSAIKDDPDVKKLIQ